jgi:hypothetical protein
MYMPYLCLLAYVHVNGNTSETFSSNFQQEAEIKKPFEITRTTTDAAAS